MAKRLKANSAIAANRMSVNDGTFIRDYSYAELLPEVKQQICDLAINGSRIRDTARVLGVSQMTVIDTLKKVQG